MNIQLRKPNEQEFLEVAQFSFANFIAETAKSSGENPEQLKNKVGKAPSKISEYDIWSIVEENKTQIGFIWIQLNKEKTAAFIYDIYIEQKYRSQGIGRHVMIECQKTLKNLGIKKIELCVFEHNTIARKLYDSLGFKEVKFDKNRKQYNLSLDL